MKKIIINGGNFYKLYKVAEILNRTFVANAFINLATLKSGKIYRIEVSGSTNEPKVYSSSDSAYLLQYQNGASIFKDNDNVQIGTFRALSSNMCQIKFASNQDSVTIRLYEYNEYIPYKFYWTITTTQACFGSPYTELTVFPTIVSGKKYSIKYTPVNFSNVVKFYVGSTEVYSKTSEQGKEYEFIYQASGDGILPTIRVNASGSKSVLISINEITE